MGSGPSGPSRSGWFESSPLLQVDSAVFRVALTAGRAVAKHIFVHTRLILPVRIAYIRGSGCHNFHTEMRTDTAARERYISEQLVSCVPQGFAIS